MKVYIRVLQICDYLSDFLVQGFIQAIKKYFPVHTNKVYRKLCFKLCFYRGIARTAIVL